MQQLIPVKRVFPDSIWQVGNNEFSQTWSFSDINYAVASLDDQRTILDSWGRVLNGLAADSRMKVTLVNSIFDKEANAGTLFLRKQHDGMDKYRAELNQVIMSKAQGSNGIVQQKFMTLTAKRKNITDARQFSVVPEKPEHRYAASCVLYSFAGQQQSFPYSARLFSAQITA